MKILKFLISLVITAALIWTLDNRINLAGSPVPPVGRFLDPFHGFWQNAETRVPDIPFELELPGLQDEVTVVFDSLMVPHIFAKNNHDLYFTQGYVTAYHRLWQMEFQVMAAAGRIAEIIGQDAIPYDRRMRRQGMVYGAEKFAEVLNNDPVMKPISDAFRNGVNAYIEQLNDEDLPLEYKLLDYRPEKWSILKSALLLKNMSNTLNIGDNDLENTNALLFLGPDMYNFLFPDHLLKKDNIVDRPGEWDFEPVKVEQDTGMVRKVITIPARYPEEPVNTGSNNWAVHGSRTASGYPLLASDPHLQLNLPSIWYTLHLNAPGVNTMGASLLGAPGVIIGFNDSIAWAETNAQRDLVDWYKIDFRDDSRKEYLLDGEWTPAELRVEEIRVREGETFFDTVAYTHWGPVIYDRTFNAGNELENYAFRWISHDPSNELRAFYYLNRAKNFNEYREALRSFHAPAQNFVFASTQNDIGITVQGKYPVRPRGVGKFLMDGSDSRNGWQAFIPFEHNAFVKNPERGFVSSANQYPADSTYPYYIHARSYEVFRNRRINQVLGSLEKATFNDMARLHNDNYNMTAAEALPVMLQHMNTEVLSGFAAEVHNELAQWDYFNDAGSVGASYFEAWFDELYPLIWDEMRAEGFAMTYPEELRTIQIMRSDPEFEFFDILETEEKETLQDLVNLSFASMITELEDWKKEHGKDVEWADFKNTYIQHLIRVPQFSHYVRTGGNHNIVNATSGRNGPSWRMIVSLEPGNVKAWGVYPGGQSGNPGSPYYDDWIGVWSNAEYHSLHFEPTLQNYEEKTFIRQTLKPGDE